MMETGRSSEKPRRLVLTGFMGAGKSTVGALLGLRLGWRFVDVDPLIESRTGLTIAEFFAAHGEPAFRQLEAQTIAELLEEQPLVLALGGGAIETESTALRLTTSSETCLIFLDAPLPELIARCEQQPGAAVRPILNDRDRLESRWKSRLPLYQQAHLRVETRGLTPETVARSIVTSLALDAANIDALPTGEPASR